MGVTTNKVTSQKGKKAIQNITNENSISVQRSSDDKQYKELHGLTRSLIFNMVFGVSEGWDDMCMYVFMYVCVHVCMYACMFNAYMYMRIYVHACTGVWIYMYTIVIHA